MGQAIVTRRDADNAVHPIDRLFHSVFARDPFAGFAGGLAGIEEGTLAIDVSEDAENVIVRASMPGFSRDEISVEVHDSVLSISASRNEESEERHEKFYRKERRTGSVSRRVALPVAVVEDDATAELKDGELTLRLPKSVQGGPRRISIN
ncbi:MAG: Hsp20/alpha crystallin family protein [Phycisphaerales bacterium]